MPRKKPPKRVKKHAEAPLVEARVNEVLALRLDGAERWDVCQYVSEMEKEKEPNNWTLEEREPPMCVRQIERYIRRADEIMRASSRVKRRALKERDLARRNNIYAKAMQAGDLNAALNALKDVAKLRGLYPAEKKEITGKDGSPLYPHGVTEVTVRTRAEAKAILSLMEQADRVP